jgi:hypothetical protein
MRTKISARTRSGSSTGRREAARYGAAPVPTRGHGVGKPAHDVRIDMSTIAKFRAAFGDMAIRSVHHNVARLDAARAFLKSED